MLSSYGKLDTSSLSKDFLLISRVIRSGKISNAIRNNVRTCRDYALSGDVYKDALIDALSAALSQMCAAIEDRNVVKIKRENADQGMTERYRPLSKKLKKEKIRRLGKGIELTNRHTDAPKDTRLVRRFVEKRAAQTVFRMVGRNRSFRQKVRRAVSFSLYNARFIDYDQNKRMHGTHWKVVYYPERNLKRLKSKRSYNTCEEALAACERYMNNHPEDSRPLYPYICHYCGKWHIGHNASLILEETA